MNLESLWDDVWTTLGLHFQHLILDYCKSVPRMDSSTVPHFQHLILTPSIYVGVWLDICVSQMARLVWIVLAYSPRDGGWVRMGGHFRSRETGWQFVELMWELMIHAGYYETVDVKKTIALYGPLGAKAKCMPRKPAPLVRRRVGHASLDWHGTITNSYNRIPWANREAIDDLVFESVRDGDDYSLLSFAGWRRQAQTRHQIEADRQLSLYFSSKGEYENMKFTRNRTGPGGKADYIVSQLREDVDWVHFDDRHIIVDEINTLRHPNLRAVLITNTYTLANGIQDLLQDRQRQQRFLDSANAAVVAAANESIAPTSKRRRLQWWPEHS